MFSVVQSASWDPRVYLYLRSVCNTQYLEDLGANLEVNILGNGLWNFQNSPIMLQILGQGERNTVIIHFWIWPRKVYNSKYNLFNWIQVTDFEIGTLNMLSVSLMNLLFLGNAKCDSICYSPNSKPNN